MYLLRKWKTALSLFVLSIAAIPAPAQTFTLLNSLSGKFGGYTRAPLVQGIDGNLYGAAIYGGLNLGMGTNETKGTIYRTNLTGTLSLVHDFQGGTEGLNASGLVLETNGNLYGTTIQGGGQTSLCGLGCGTVFGFTSQGTIFLLHSFSGGADGQGPMGLTLGPDGSTFYGVTQNGGTPGFGTVFKITPTGTFTTLHSFTNTTADGAYPSGSLVVGTNGNLYGTTFGDSSSTFGTVFMITPGGTLTTLHSFNGTDGDGPNGALVQAANGNFYGTTAAGGKNGAGAVFFISPGGHTFQSLYSFIPPPNGSPWTGLVLGSDGNFYGTIFGSGEGGWYGSLFEITPGGVFTTLHTFDGTDGAFYPYLMQDTNGTFYGTTSDFGAGEGCIPIEGCGTFFSLSMGLSPFVEAVPAYRGIGAKVLLLGQGFTGATSVTFNGVEATFTVNSDTEITTTVPTGATKGYIVVTTPSGTVSTKVFFTVG
jgi:uncharacterized repeat protein (TIGR03803 family)